MLPRDSSSKGWGGCRIEAEANVGEWADGDARWFARSRTTARAHPASLSLSLDDERTIISI